MTNAKTKPTMSFSKLDQGTLVPISLFAVVLVTVVSAYGWLESRFSELRDANLRAERRQERIELRLEQMEKSVEERANDRWTYADMQLWVRDLESKNEAIKVPEAKPLRSR